MRKFKLTPRRFMWCLLALVLCALTTLNPIVMFSIYGISFGATVLAYFLTYFVYCLMENKWLSLKEFDELQEGGYLDGK